MLVAAFIFVISLAAVIQFAVLSWRAALLKTALAPLPTEWEPAAESAAKSFISKGFQGITAYSKLCPELGGSSAPKFGSLRSYYRLVQLFGWLSRSIVPQNTAWLEKEMAMCTRCAAVMLSQQLQHTQALSAAARSF
jgi:hypothetical protein